MDIFNINGIFNQIDNINILSDDIISKLTNYIYKLSQIFLSIQIIYNMDDVDNSIDVFLYGLELKDTIKTFYKEHTNSLVKYKYHTNTYINTKICLLFEYIIYDILDMMYSYATINGSDVLTVKSLIKIMNNDLDFTELNKKYKILFLEDSSTITTSYFKRLVKNIIPDKRMKTTFITLLQNYFEYGIIEKIHLNDINSINSRVNKLITITHYKQEPITLECNSSIHYINI